MIARRALLCAAAASAAARRAWAIPATPDRLAFDVLRKGDVIGTHVVVFERKDNDLLVRSDVAMKVGIGPLTLFRYRHQAIERWRGDAFAGIETTTDNDGEALRVSARRVGDRIEIDSSKLGRRVMAGNALPLSHWNIGCMAAPLFNPQDGTALDAPVTARGTELVALADGSRVRWRRFSMGGEAPLDDWYDDTQSWVRLRATAKDGSVVEYRRTA